MKDFLANLPGPFFDFLVTNGDHWERSGKTQSIKGIKSEYFHHPDALRVQEVIVEQVASCFQEAHPSFNYYGPTDFRNENLNGLLNKLGEWIAQCRLCETERDFSSLLTPYFLEEVQSSVQDWPEQWPTVREQLSEKIIEVRDTGRIAQRTGKTLLVLGI